MFRMYYATIILLFELWKLSIIQYPIGLYMYKIIDVIKQRRFYKPGTYSNDKLDITG